MDKVTIKWWVDRCTELENRIEDLMLQLESKSYEVTELHQRISEFKHRDKARMESGAEYPS